MTDQKKWEPFADVKNGVMLFCGKEPVLPSVQKNSDRILKIVADKINAAHEKAVAERVREAVEEFRGKVLDIATFHHCEHETKQGAAYYCPAGGQIANEIRALPVEEK